MLMKTFHASFEGSAKPFHYRVCVWMCVCASVLLCVYTQVRVCLCVCLYVCTKVCVCLTLKGRMQIADEYAAAPYREMIAWFCLWRRDHPLWRRFIVKPQKWQKSPLSGLLCIIAVKVTMWVLNCSGEELLGQYAWINSCFKEALTKDNIPFS